MSRYLTQLDDELCWFPDPEHALEEPNGLLAIGGDLSPARLLAAYHKGIFPWNEPHQPLLWWSPDPRGVIRPEQLHIGRTLRKFIRSTSFDISIDRAFNEVIAACAAPRRSASGTWISTPMIDAYRQLHRLGHAHSIEIWQEGQLQAGLYGLSLGQVFCGESMFSRIDNGAKLAMVALCRHFARHDGALIDCQMQNDFLATLGIEEWPRRQFLTTLAQLSQQPLAANCWQTGSIHL
ncbi:leucyl/phenylalanyl-tRNA--protein transferase [Aeromonas hydrophila]|uniref:leucyl/phenylalanyl-tRNA--protein transferase n=1 Tax=Aeromonas hydrophila TaxID=644 RepID=UPI000463870E|nr:leucyl/phenylalanyl-tRNA--protein transferase [Aeromonas hydrophila]ELO1554915.1 leucyl/phenylalanyl-tRNA--protein transferase [Aeromonas hydrophila]HAT2491912.1 leucyl/phenylalanyl-tRNA--protein transferase [Aeromonas hydrophila]HAT2496658.1 leucyl/phenylalanyl-tRNA--protein transferase [Aeromonas hydrophila]HAT2512050.1 leucyl/phenylalanyl-tRNA--protein transferase [Aeromonas hydrophila]HAT2532542.1 leucyl/phenylalanyl-tRNA--protein transferase [Aeromonas hydrophila]